MCNPGAAGTLLGLSSTMANFDITSRDAEGHFDTPAAVQESYARNEHLEKLVKEEGVVRVSFGLTSTLGDCACFIQFVRTFVEVDDLFNTRNAKQLEDHIPWDKIAVDRSNGRSSSSSVMHLHALNKFAAYLGRCLSR